MRLTDFLAVYGAVVSTATFGWNYFRAKPQIRVVPVFAIEEVDGESQCGLGVSIQNTSSQTVHLTTVSFLSPFGKSTFATKLKYLIRNRRMPWRVGWASSSLSLNGLADGCPISIEPNKAHWIFIREEVLERVLEKSRSRKFKFVVQDALWRNTYSKVFEYPRPTIDTGSV